MQGLKAWKNLKTWKNLKAWREIQTRQRERLLVRLSWQAEEDQFWWCPPAAQAKSLTVQEAASLSQRLPAEVLLDARAVRVDWLSLPPGVKPEEAPLLLEEQLAQPLETVAIIRLQKKGRQVQTATLDQAQAKNWQERISGYGIEVKRWLPEQLAIAEAAQEAASAEALVFQEKDWVGQYQQALDRLTFLPESIMQPLATAARTPPQDKQFLPKGAWVPFLAPYLPPRINLWPGHASWQRLQLWHQLRSQGARLLPWFVLLVLLAGQALIPVFLGPAGQESAAQLSVAQLSVAQQEAQLQALADLEKRQTLQQAHHRWQKERLAAWRPLEELLAQHPHWQLSALTFDAEGVSARLQGLQETDPVRLRQLPGRWTFNENRAHWERPL